MTGTMEWCGALHLELAQGSIIRDTVGPSFFHWGGMGGPGLGVWMVTFMRNFQILNAKPFQGEGGICCRPDLPLRLAN